MGCGSSSPAKVVGDTNHSAPPKPPPPPAGQPPPQEVGAQLGPDPLAQDGSVQDGFAHDGFAPSELQGKGGEDAMSSEQTSSGQGHTATPSLLSSRQSLIAASGSLGSKIGRSTLLPAGWAPGAGVLVREDARTAHINNLACTIIKVPVVLVVSVDSGRPAVAASRGLEVLGPRAWLPAFWAWLAGQDLAEPLVIADAASDLRTRGQAWVTGSPGIRFVAACSINSASEGDAAGTLVGVDTQPHGAAAAGAGLMLGNLANMVTRELEGPPPPGASEYWVGERCVPPRLRCRLDAYGWTTLLLDAGAPRWRLLYGNLAFRKMTGVPPGCLEGHAFWDYFDPQQPLDAAQEPWQACAPALERGAVFQLPPLLFRPAASAPALKSAQLLRVEMRRFDAETAQTFEAEPPGEGDGSLWLASFQPESRFAPGAPPGTPPLGSNSLIPFPSLDLGPVIGKGSFGCVCRGALGYLLVAVKIIEGEAIFRVDAEGMPLEASLARNLRHPHVVQMVDYATRVRKDQPRSRTASRRGTLGSPGASPHSPRSMDGAPSGGGLGLGLGEGVHYGSDAGRLGTLGTLGSRASSVMGSALSAGGGAGGGTVEAWLIMEYCDSGSLLEGIESEWFGTKPSPDGGPRRPDVAAIEATAYEIASAMRYLHRHNILHGDLTASNVLLASAPATPADRRGFVAKVADFGLSREAVTSKVETVSHGTVTHMPPELLNEQVLSKKADVYAFGVLLVEMYTGERAFTGMRHPQIIHTIAVLRRHPQLPPDAPPHLIELAEDCMREEYKKRPTFDEVMDRLRPRLAAAHAP